MKIAQLAKTMCAAAFMAAAMLAPMAQSAAMAATGEAAEQTILAYEQQRVQVDASAFIAAEQAEGNGSRFVSDSFSFGVEREMKESGEKGG